MHIANTLRKRINNMSSSAEYDRWQTVCLISVVIGALISENGGMYTLGGVLLAALATVIAVGMYLYRHYNRAKVRQRQRNVLEKMESEEFVSKKLLVENDIAVMQETITRNIQHATLRQSELKALLESLIRTQLEAQSKEEFRAYVIDIDEDKVVSKAAIRSFGKVRPKGNVTVIGRFWMGVSDIESSETSKKEDEWPPRLSDLTHLGPDSGESRLLH